MNKITIASITDPEQEAVWDRYVTENQNATGYHLVAWRHVVSRTFGHQTFHLMAQETTGDDRGVLLMVFLSGSWFGRFVVSLPYFNWGGLLADTTKVGNALLAHAELPAIAGVSSNA